MRKLLNIALCFAYIFLLNNSVYSQGWILEESNNRVTYIGNGWVKAVEGDMEEVPITSMYNPGSNIIIMINEGDMTYAKGSADDFCNSMKSFQSEMNKNMPAEQQKMMEEMIAQQKAKPEPKITIEKSGDESIAGYSTTKYSISVDGELFEEKWISTDASLRGLVQIMNSTVDMGHKLAGCSVPDESFLKNAPEFSKQYLDIERSGVELKSIRYEFGNADTDTEVVSIEKENLPSDEFKVPGDYSEVSFQELIMSMSGM